MESRLASNQNVGVRWQEGENQIAKQVESKEPVQRPDINDADDDESGLSSMASRELGDKENAGIRSSPTSTSRPSRPHYDSRGYTDFSTHLPPLKRNETRMMQKEAHPKEHLGITLGLPAIILFDLVVPCIIYYTWYNSHVSDWKRQCRERYNSTPSNCPIAKPEYDKDILGYAIVSFGFGELWILGARVWRLYFRREECAPLLSRNKWELDAKE